MKALFLRLFAQGENSSAWDTESLIREERFSIERLEEHAKSLALAQSVALKQGVLKHSAGNALSPRLKQNGKLLFEAYHTTANAVLENCAITPAAEWLLDNYHVVEEQIRNIEEDLPPGYYQQLPKLASGPLVGYPRVFGIAWAFVAHTDSLFDAEMLHRVVQAYQTIQPLEIGELWALAITLRIVLIENLRRAAVQIITCRQARQKADTLADHLLGLISTHSATLQKTREAVGRFLHQDPQKRLPAAFIAQLVQRLRDQDPSVTPGLLWLEQYFQAQATSADQIVHEEHQSQGAANITVRNIITSMRMISSLDWNEWFERVSVVEQILRTSPDFARMDFATRNAYRSAIEVLSRGASAVKPNTHREHRERVASALNKTLEWEIALQVVQRSQAEGQDPGFFLMGQGRAQLERDFGFKAAPNTWLCRWITACGFSGYLTLGIGLTALILALPLMGLAKVETGPFWILLLGAMGVLPALGAAIELINRAIASGCPATLLPALDFSEGIPAECTTMVVMPTLLTSLKNVDEQIAQLELHYLANPQAHLYFALLTDWPDAATETTDQDAPLLEAVSRGVDALNQRYESVGSEPRFFLLHRPRLWNASQGCWMGWERKRGKLENLNQWLRSDPSSVKAKPFVSLNGLAPVPPQGVHYVITLDSDTRMPIGTVARLIGKMAHPLNQPHVAVDSDHARVVKGHAVLQPRVTASLPIDHDGSIFQKVFSQCSGIDPYASAVSDVYQDLFGEGSYAGKGIYQVDAFQAALNHRIPDNTLLSHDLFEGLFTRAGLASDIEVLEEFPARYDVHAARQHRWARGDWQLLPWLLGIYSHKNTAKSALRPIDTWKMLDNLRRTLAAPVLMLGFLAGFMLPTKAALLWTGFLLMVLSLPAFMPVLLASWPRGSRNSLSGHLATWSQDIWSALAQTGLMIAFLAHQACLMSDAIARTLFRLFVSHGHLLEWTTAAQTAHLQAQSHKNSLTGFYQQMLGSVLFAGFALWISLQLQPDNAALIAPFIALWLAAPALARWISESPRLADQLRVAPQDARALRLIARRTWRFFETFVTPQDDMLPPDNFQEAPQPIVAHRTSPTNMGLYLLSAASARDFGWASTLETLDRLEATLNTMESLPKFKGHFYNWYDTQDGRPLDPPYISAVDSGNLAGHLITLANACREWAASAASTDARTDIKGDDVRPPVRAEIFNGIEDTITLAREALGQRPAHRRRPNRLRFEIESTLDELLETLKLTTLSPIERLRQLTRLVAPLTDMTRAFASEQADENASDLLFWASATQQSIEAHWIEHNPPHCSLINRLHDVAQRSLNMAEAMAFGFLLDADRQLLSIGYAVNEGRLDHSCYDLLASEARLASFVAIAKGDLPEKHWFRLGRSVTAIERGAALISWSGSMFEYLMPSLVMRAPSGSLIENSNRLIVSRQMHYAKPLGVPWGISESAYNTRDLELTYQYSNFGIPGLGLKRGLADNLVIAPYATALAAMIAPAAAVSNFTRLKLQGALGRYGFYEALDYTRSRLRDGQTVAVIRAYMAHHQGMSIVAIANTLHQGAMRRRFHAEPKMQAAELLLQERSPREATMASPRTEEHDRLANVRDLVLPMGRVLQSVQSLQIGKPLTQLLSNGSYTVMLTAAGSGYSQWQQAGQRLGITRWQEDGTRDAWGSYIYLRDTQNGELWSAGYQPVGNPPDQYEVTFRDDRAEFIRKDGPMITALEVVVSPEDPAEVRRVTLSNTGHRARLIEVTSYAELVLAPPVSDRVHPAFSKLFVQTDYLPKAGAILATRRRRNPEDPEIWAAHLAIVEAPTSPDLEKDLEIETDRARFLGRGMDNQTPLAILEGQPLSNTVGTVLDPVFALRRRVLVPAGGSARLAFWTILANSRSELMDLLDKHHDTHAYSRASTLAWTQMQVQGHYLGVDHDEAGLFQTLGGHILYHNPRMRPASDRIRQGAGGPEGLWPFSISGDIPIVLVRIREIEQIGLVRQLLRAHEYLRLKQLRFDLVILNEQTSSYVQDLQNALDTLIRASQSRPAPQALKGIESTPSASVYSLRADAMSARSRDLLASVARVVLDSQRGTLSEQLNRVQSGTALSKPILSKRLSMPGHFMPHSLTHSLTGEKATSLLSTQTLKNSSAETAMAVGENVRAWASRHMPQLDASRLLPPLKTPVVPDLQFYNGLGGFSPDGREYVTVLGPGQSTPAPWVNIIANPAFGFQVSAEGSGYTWSRNSRENQLTPWSNDPVSDAPGEVIYVRDDDTGQLWGPTALPIRNDLLSYTARHGQGYSRFEHTAHGIALNLLQYVAMDNPVKISRLTLTNLTAQTRRLSVTAYVEWVMGQSRSDAAPYLITMRDAETGALFCQNPWKEGKNGQDGQPEESAASGRVGWMDLNGLAIRRQNLSWTGDRQEFLGRHGSTRHPAGLDCDRSAASESDPAGSRTPEKSLSNRTGAGLDPCGAMNAPFTLKPNQSVEIVFLLGESDTMAHAQAMIQKYRTCNLDDVLQGVIRYWDETLGTLQVKTPDPAMDLMLNRWMLYQTLVCRVFARSAFYQASGSYGFRDQLQDGMALALARPDLTREHLLRAAARQFEEGDMQHWWLPHSGQGVRTHISDDRLWLAYATAHYLETTGDLGVLDEQIPFLRGPLLSLDQHDAFYQPDITPETASLFEHCARGIDLGLSTGQHGLPLMGTGDWNDGMNRVGAGGQGESVWLGWFLMATISSFLPLAQARKDRVRAAKWLAHRKKLQRALEREGWDGDWYRRGYFDDGSPLGSASSSECQIDAIAQSWSVLSGAGDPARACHAMAAVEKHLIRAEDGLALLFTPPFDKTLQEPGYIKGYPPGIRENGGQYTHAATWSIIAFAMLGQGDKAAQLFAMLNPVHHADSRAGVQRYKVEPYVVAADVYSVAPHLGRGGWTWYTGAAGWLYRAGVESILGLKRQGAFLEITPCIPKSWARYEMTYHYESSRYDIVVENPHGVNQGIAHATFDGQPLAEGSSLTARVALRNDSATHQIHVILGVPRVPEIV